ncbi:MAG: hypothetical protein JNJ59_15110, partial [Deltaproteobacteria bacterium]|nr:hypothetical protein [Deltaproteobacteria bacterium]
MRSATAVGDERTAGERSAEAGREPAAGEGEAVALARSEGTSGASEGTRGASEGTREGASGATSARGGASEGPRVPRARTVDGRVAEAAAYARDQGLVAVPRLVVAERAVFYDGQERARAAFRVRGASPEGAGIRVAARTALADQADRWAAWIEVTPARWREVVADLGRGPSGPASQGGEVVVATAGAAESQSTAETSDRTTGPQPGQATSSAQVENPEFRRRALAGASGTIDRINDLMSYGAFDWAITDAEALQAIRALQALPGTQRFVVCQELARGSALSRLIENLPAGASAQCPNAYLTICAIARDPRRIRPFFDAAPRVDPVQDAPAIGAILSQLPDDIVREQALGRVRNQVNAQLHAWIAIAPEPTRTLVSTRYENARRQAQADVQAQTDRQARERTLDQDAAARMRGTGAADRSFQDRIHRIQDLLSYGVFDWAITDGDARHVMQVFGESEADIPAMVHALDARDQTFMNRLLENLPTADRYGVHQRAFIRVLSGRRPENNLPFVREMLSVGFLNSVSGEEASLAFQIIRTMPRDLQDQIRGLEGGQVWARLEGSLDQRQANDRDANLYGNTEERQRLMLAYREGITTWPVPQLMAQTEMLCRMGQDAFVERSLREAGADAAAPRYRGLYARFGFAHDGRPRDERVFAAWRDNSAGDRADPNFFQRAGAGLILGGQLVGAAIDVGATGSTDLAVDLNRAQTAAGGTLGGMVLAERQHDEDNRVLANVDLNAGRLALRGEHLDIASIARMADGVSIQTGPVTIAGIDVELKWPTERDPGSRMRVAISTIRARDIWQSTPQAMLNVGLLVIQQLIIEALRPPGTSPGDRQQGIGMLFQELQETATRLMGLLQGASPDAGQLSAQLGQSLGHLQARVTIGSIEVENVSNSQGGFVGGAQVRGVRVSVQNRRKGDVARERLAELERLGRGRSLTAEEQTERAAVERRLQELAPLEARERELSRREADHSGRPSHLPILGTGAPESEGLNAGERDELARLRNELTMSSAGVGVDDIHVTNVSMGGTTASDVHVTALRAEVSAAPRTGNGTATGGSDAVATFQVGSVTARDVQVQGGNRLEATEARVAQLEARVAARQATEDERRLYATLSAQVTDVHRMMAVRDRARLDPAGASSLRGADLALHQRAEAELPGWLTRDEGSSVRALSLTGDNGGAAITGRADLSGGQVSTRVANAHMEGVHQAGREVRSIDAHGVEVGAQVSGDLRGGAQPAGAEPSLMSRLTNANFDAERLEMAGYHAQGQSLSATLSTEQRQLQRASDLGQATSAQRARLDALPGLIEEARRAEARLGELRSRQASPGLSREESAELQALASRCDPHTMHVETVRATAVHARMSQQGGLDLQVGRAGSGEAGLTMTGFRQGTVGPNGQETTTRSIDRMQAESMHVTANANGGLAGLADSANLGSNRSGLNAGVSGTGLEMQGFTQGQAGQSGYQHANTIRARGFGVGYNQAEAGGTATVNLEGASAEGVTRQSGRLDSLDQAIAQYTAQEHSGRPLTAGQQAHVAELRAQRRGYEQLQADLGRARSQARRRQIQRQIADWERIGEQRIATVSATGVNATVTNVGNVMDDRWSAADQNMGVRAHVGRLDVGRVEQSDERGRMRQQVASARVSNVDVTGDNVLGANGQASSLRATVGELDARGVRAGSAGASRVTGRGIAVGMTGQDASVSAERLDLSGAHSGNNSAGHIGLSHVRAGVTGIGTRDQRVAGSAGGVSLSNGRARTAAMDASVRSLRGRRASFSMGRGGMTASVASFSGEGVAVTTRGVREDAAARMSVPSEDRYRVDRVAGRGASLSTGGGTTRVGLAHAEASGVHAEGDALAGRTLDVRRVTVDGVNATMGERGTFRVGVAQAGVDGVRLTEADGRHATTVEHAHVRDVSARGDRSGLSHGHVGELEVREVQVDRADLSATLHLATATDLNAEGVNFAAGTVERASVGTADVRGARATLRDPATGGETRVGVEHARVERAVGSVETGGITRGSLGRARVEGATVSGDLSEEVGTSSSGGAMRQITGRRDGRVDLAEVTDVAGGYNATTREAAGTWGGARVEGARYDETGRSGASRRHIDADRISTGAGMARIDDTAHPERGLRATADDTRV